MKGKVYLIGAGPGDPGLLTLKGLACLQKADVIVYDALINARILEWARPSVPKIFVGKHGSHHTMEQHQINELLAQHAQKGRLVARLKGGDPLVFGRGSEEASFLAERDIPFEIISGVTSATGALAYAGIPLTDRNTASMATLVTGHGGEISSKTEVDWPRISRQSTLVIFMGLDQLPTITVRLQKHMWPKDMPAAIIYWGTTSEQQVLEGTLGTIAEKAKKANLSSPVLIVIGKVVSLRSKLKWFEELPLFGTTVVITRAYEQAMEFANQLEAEGARVLSFPTIQFAPPKSWAPLDAAIAAMLPPPPNTSPLATPSPALRGGRNKPAFDWILFTSVNGVDGFFERLYARGGDIRDLKGVQLGAIGPKTSAALTERGLRVDAFPDEYRAEALAEKIPVYKGMKVLIARAEVARDVLPKTLEAKGALVTIAPVYRTLKTTRVAKPIKEMLLKGFVDVVTFTSSSTVENFMAHFSARERKKIFETTKAAAIGPITAATLKEFGVRPTIEASRYTTEHLTRAIVKFVESKK